MFELYLDVHTRLSVRPGTHGFLFSMEMAGDTVADGFRLTDRDGGTVFWTRVEVDEGAMLLTGVVDDRWKVTAEISVVGERSPRAAWSVQAMYVGDAAIETGFDAEWSVHIQNAEPFVPGIFYGENRPRGRGSYPRWSAEFEPEDRASSPTWKFRTDRTMTPLVMLRAEGLSAALVTSDRFSHGASGIGFSADATAAALSVHFPYREEPLRYAPFHLEGDAAEAPLFRIAPGETVCFSFEVYAGAAGSRSLLRDTYVDDPQCLNPWMPGAEASELAADGLLNWHYDPANSALYETAGFDRYFRPGLRQWDRKHMHVAWVSGLPYAYALAHHGALTGSAQQVNAGLDVIDEIAGEGIAPAGMFYPQWTEDAGWTGGWVDDDTLPPVAQSRTISEATWFLLKALTDPEGWAIGDRLTRWENAVRTNLDYAVKIQREDGSFGTYYNLETGVVEEWNGAGGLMWIPALLLAARYRNAFGSPFAHAADYLAAASRAGIYYAQMIRTKHLAGAPEDVPYGVTSEDGYNALIAMMGLYEETTDDSWLRLACQAADYALSFRMSYNATFPQETLLGRYDFRSKGADIASPCNQHLHNYGYICIPALLRLWRLSGDDFYFARARDHVFCFRQFVARGDGDFNARRGMVPEQLFHTDWTHPKGMVLPLAHSWCAGWIILVEDWLRDWGTLFVDPLNEKLYVIESVEILDEDWEGGVVTIRNPWNRDVDLTVVNMASAERAIFHLPACETHMFQISGA
ncbi:MAG TPA: hypothetical protein VGM51_11515 [Armatimonadota bacterium]|jgi:hypothetical protein